MENVYVIGDCHTARIFEHYDKKTSPVNFKMWGKGGMKVWDFDFQAKHDANEFSTGTEAERTGFENKPVNFNDINDNGIAIIWLGYIDVRQFLPKYKNADLVAKMYIDKVTGYFKKAKIVIAEPLPQFTEMLLKYEGISPSYTYEERLEQNRLFLESMHKYAEMAGIKDFITQDEIHDAIGARELTPEMTHDKAPHPVDGLQDKYNKKIYELFEKKALEVLSK